MCKTSCTTIPLSSKVRPLFLTLSILQLLCRLILICHGRYWISFPELQFLSLIRNYSEKLSSVDEIGRGNFLHRSCSYHKEARKTVSAGNVKF